MTYWTDDRRLDVEQRRLDAAQADAKRVMEAARASLPSPTNEGTTDKPSSTR